MPTFDTYGTNTYAAPELSGLLADRLNVTFAERDSFYRGIYSRATLADTTRIEIQPNAIPGDDGELDPYDQEHPEVAVLLIVTSPDGVDPSTAGLLSAIDGLSHLRSSRTQPPDGQG